jgi:hypothetical protein
VLAPASLARTGLTSGSKPRRASNCPLLLGRVVLFKVGFSIVGPSKCKSTASSDADASDDSGTWSVSSRRDHVRAGQVQATMGRVGSSDDWGAAVWTDHELADSSIPIWRTVPSADHCDRTACLLQEVVADRSEQ